MLCLLDRLEDGFDAIVRLDDQAVDGVCKHGRNVTS
jgi:hypothetical protein